MSDSLWQLQSDWFDGNADNGRLELTLINSSSNDISDFRLCYTSQLTACDSDSIAGGHWLLADGSYHEITPDKNNTVLTAGSRWKITLTNLNFKPAHANDGPKNAFLVIDNAVFAIVAVKALTSNTVESSTVENSNSIVIEQSSDYQELCLSITPFPNDILITPSSAQPPDNYVVDMTCAFELREQVSAVENLRSVIYPDKLKIFYNQGSGIRLSVSLADLDQESYQIHFQHSGIEIFAGDLAGVFYASITLCQLWEGAREHPDQFHYPAPGSIIRDSPRYAWRGTHLDVARHFYPLEEITRTIAIAAWYKMNRFHWHLTDDEGWRVEINAYPELIEVGSTRGFNKPIPPQLSDGPNGSSGHYTQDEIKSVVNYAADLHIEIMPEIDLPGHSTAALRSISELSDPGEKPNSYRSVQGFYNNALNPALPTSEKFAYAVIDELIPLFPGSAFHIGADEVPDTAWLTSPAAKAHVRTKRLKSVTQLQHEFIFKLHRRIAEHGKLTGIWDDGTNDLLSPSQTLVFVWRHPSHAYALAEKGFNLVVTPAQAYYLDIAQSCDWNVAGAGWAGQTSLETSYHYDFSATENKIQITGIQSAIWSEHISDKYQFNQLVFPRLYAVAEGGWTHSVNKSLRRFKKIIGFQHPLL